eukprot:2648771-Prymnesium_polylepis.1
MRGRPPRRQWPPRPASGTCRGGRPTASHSAPPASTRPGWRRARTSPGSPPTRRRRRSSRTASRACARTRRTTVGTRRA